MNRRHLSLRGGRGRWLARANGRLAMLPASARPPATACHELMPDATLDGTRSTRFAAARRTPPLAALQRPGRETGVRPGHVGVFCIADPHLPDVGAIPLTVTGRRADPA